MAATEQLDELFEVVLRENASDLHLTVGRRPSIRIAGALSELGRYPILTPASSHELVLGLLTKEQQERYLEYKELDLSYGFKDNKARFRVNVFFQRGFMGAALRLIPSKIRTLEELNIPAAIAAFADRQQGFVLVVGPTGHGKSTTLAALVDYINHRRTDHIITIEDPVEYLFTPDRAIVDQREVGADTRSFHRALKSVFREDVDVVLIGEMRDAETMATAVTAAETGHLIFSSLHTNSASQTIDRIIDSFPGAQQAQIRSQLSTTLVAIVSQRLIPRVQGGLIPAVEIMIANPAVRNLIREGKEHEIDFVIETSSDQGMVSLNRALADLVKRNEITMENAVAYSLDPQELATLMRR
ncbi:MAG: type IV pili twitching motility protein PilT [Candidatus Sungbacteria bacterium RIFCSPLOWO2_01_FULL_60_25]|uniref:Type IV pili twitching motility protein PilT n=1 Tax=Candidatus Sungbacteria bacterium RIFCSPLOWO2_01_FULL_60_25 TaxID=1802281 RepID=A0A1G2L9W7_9BACT|nr:MAG: type IV pili twitching motility protein PilT [Candidatus Sungbacteria bacterium RIFCSPLOWO2_01_FULL_60_25]